MLSVKQRKTQLRNELRAARQRLSKDKRIAASIAISQQLRNLDEYHESERIGVYLATSEEISLDPFIVQARKDSKKLFLPVISKTSGEKRMFLQSWTEEDELAENRYGIAEPKNTGAAAGTRVADTPLDLMLIPVVGYSPSGSRLGMGAGYYDRYLDQLGNSSKTKRIGIAHTCQHSDEIPQEEWDKKMHMLVNEKEVLRFLLAHDTSEIFY